MLVSDATIPVGERLKPRPDTESDSTVPAEVDVAVIGAGVIGLSIAWALAKRGLAVAVFDRGDAGAGASLAATGMLAAAAEHETGGENLLALALQSQREWPEFRSAVEADAGVAIDYRDEGTLLVALGRDEVERLRFRHAQQRRDGLDTQWLGGLDVRRIEPALRPSVTAGILCRGDHQVDPRRLVPALATALRVRGGLVLANCPVAALEASGDGVSAVVTPKGRCRTSTVVAASGAWIADGHLPSSVDIPLRPLKGQALALRSTPGTLSRIVWTEQVHLAPKTDGRLIVGATMEDAGFDPTITAGGVLALLEGVHRALPSSEEMQIEAIWSGFRPTTDDDAPVLGATTVPGLVVAAGHHRNGILLAPATASAIADLVTTGEMPEVARRFGLERFQSRARARGPIVGASP